MPHSPAGPRTEYESRLDRWRAINAREQARFRTIGNWRLAVAGVAAALGWLAFFRDAISGWWLLAPLAVFIALVIVHDRVARLEEHSARAIAWYERGLARLEGRWAGTGSAGERFRDPSHVYTEDIDVFGRGSLFELLCAARTGSGEEMLARWLAAQAPPAEVRARQEAVAELRGGLDLREDLALLGEQVSGVVKPQVLSRWGGEPALVFPGATRWIVRALAWLAAAAAVTWAIDATWGVPLGGGRPLLYVFLAELVVVWRLRRAVEHVIHSVEEPAKELSLLSVLLARLEREIFTSARLRDLHARLEPEHRPASQLIAELDRLVERREWSENLFFRIPARLLMWDERYAIRIEDWRRRHGPQAATWMAVVGEMEALSSLAAYAYEHPEAPFPELVDSSALFEARQICHPLMHPGQCIANDVVLGGEQLLLIVSGSNMSGKSTLLRAVGLNAVLALAGAPVACASLRLSPLAAGASLRTIDSIQTGRSRFYAEITRLRQILDLTAGDRPVLFLLDELLHGTNSHDRRIGAAAIVRSLLDRGGFGLITTHDLALAHIADELQGRAANVHFEDQLIDGEIRFDYRMRPGVVLRSNALELMRAVGLLSSETGLGAGTERTEEVTSDE